MRHVLVTGATGFIGRRLVARLRADDVSVVGMTRNPHGATRTCLDRLTWRAGDLEKRHTVKGICDGVDTVFHLAAYAHALDDEPIQSAARHQRVSVEGTRVLVEEARAAGVARFVFASSVKAMGESTIGCADETTDCAPETAYGKAKRQAEQIVLKEGQACGMHVSVLRLPLVYGPGARGNLPRIISAASAVWLPTFPEFGNRRSMVHVADVVQALMLAAIKPQANGQIYLVTDASVYSTREVYDIIRAALGRRPARWAIPFAALKAAAAIGDLAKNGLGRAPFDSAALEKLMSNACYSCEKIQRELGYRPRHIFVDAVPEMVACYHDGWKHIRTERI